MHIQMQPAACVDIAVKMSEKKAREGSDDEHYRASFPTRSWFKGLCEICTQDAVFEFRFSRILAQLFIWFICGLRLSYRAINLHSHTAYQLRVFHQVPTE